MKQLVITTTDPGFMGSAGSKPHVPMSEFEPITGNLLSLRGIYPHPHIKHAVRGQMYIHGEAEYEAGYDIPRLVKGDVGQMSRSYDKQDIVLKIRDKEIKLNAVCMSEGKSADEPGTWYFVRPKELKETLKEVDHTTTMW